MNCIDAIEKLNAEKAALKSTPAKERLFRLFDDGSFTELDKFQKNSGGLCEVYTAYGFVGGSPAYAFSQDITVSYGAMGRMQAKKIKRIYDLAAENGVPVIGIFDSDGAHVDEGVEALEAYSELIASAGKLSGVVPQVSVIAGACIGSSAVLASLADVVVASKDSEFYVNSPKVLDDKSGRVGTAALAAENGAAHILADSCDEALDSVRNLFAYLPQNNLSVAPFADYIAPQPLDVSSADSIINGVVDGGSFFALSEKFAQDAVTGFARICGNAVGVVATNAEDGFLSSSAALKITRFVRLCDAFSIPIVTFLNCRGFLGSIENEIAGDVKSVAALTHAYAEATSPKITVITGCAVGAGFVAMAGRASGADSVVAWPCSVIGTLNAETAVELLYKDRLAAGEDREKLEAEYEQDVCSPFKAAAAGFIDDIIEPNETALKLASLLEMLSGKRVNTLAKKHSNMPL